MQVGADFNALVLDPGSSVMKLGYAGAENPQTFWDSNIGFIPEPSSSTSSFQHTITPSNARQYYNDQISVYQPGKQVQQTIQNGLIVNFEQFESNLASAFTHMKVNPISHPLLISEPIYNTKPRREKLSEIIFESFRSPQFTMVHDAVLDTFSVGKPAGLVVNIGSGKTSITAVIDGNVIYNSARVTKIGGDSIDVLLNGLLTNTYGYNRLPLQYEYNRCYDGDGEGGGGGDMVGGGGGDCYRGGDYPQQQQSGSGKKKIRLVENGFGPGGSSSQPSSWHSYMERKLLRDIKHQCLRVPMTPYNPEVGSEIENFYTLPDGNIINIGEIGCILGESYFTPIYKLGKEIITDFDDNNQHNKSTSYTFTKFQTLPLFLYSCMIESDPDLRSMLLGNIILSGGGTLLHGLSQRLQIELSSMLPSGGFGSGGGGMGGSSGSGSGSSSSSNTTGIGSSSNTGNSSSGGGNVNINITKQLTNSERQYGTWLGGSIAASLSSFAPRFIYKSEYEEYGTGILVRKMI